MTPVTQAGTLPQSGSWLVRGCQRLARRELLACAFVMVLTLGLRAALLPWLPVPRATVTDEFSHLLAADTYAHGRVTNPTPPFWEHYETFHVLMQPTYQSKYQPLQGLVLAFGQKFFGEPWVAVYLSAGLMCGALCWMLQGWVPPGWALLGALLFMCRVGIVSYWMNSYLGAAVPAIGGALALGAAARILWRGEFGHSITWAMGLAILALSRPFDAVVLGGVTAAIMLWFLVKSRTRLVKIWKQVALPALLVLASCAAGVGYNNWRVTGKVLTLPYNAYDRQYVMATMFTFTPLSPKISYRHTVMRQLGELEVRRWNDARYGWFGVLLGKLFVFDTLFFPFWVLFIPIFLWPYDLNTSEERATVVLLLVFVLMITPLILVLPHYAAAFAGVFYVRLVHSLTRLDKWRPWGKPLGRVVGVLLIGLVVVAFGNGVSGMLRNGKNLLPFVPGRDSVSEVLAHRDASFGAARDSVIRTLRQQVGRQLVMVRYSPEHNMQDEWVYNRADIGASSIVWAREMTPAQDESFVEYFRDRKVWLLEPDLSPLKLSPYPLKGQP